MLAKSLRIKVEARSIAIKKIVNAIALGNKRFSDERSLFLKIKERLQINRN
ncbi:hypothetical protein [uncultured Nostoc sp.]|uniref:hypothetical protein n=1 Tax=uncultured Nostoc sp. TaxID=340711 RepID=UPI0035CAFDEB